MTENPADLILHSGKVATQHDRRCVAEAAAIRDGRFAAIRTDREVTRYRLLHTDVVDPNNCRRFTHAEQVTESSWKGGDTASSSGDLFQTVTSQLVAVFRARGCALPLVEQLPHVKLLRSVWGPEYGGELEYLRTIVFKLRKKIEKNSANPEYIVSERGIGYRFRNPVGVARRFAQTDPRLEPLEGETRAKLQGTGFLSAEYVVPRPAVPIGELGGAR